MSHVVSAQPSSTSPYQPTEVQEKGVGFKPSRRSVTMETREGREDCCFRADKSQGCFVYYCCNFLSSICGAVRDCTEKCCNCCADCLNDCCEDKPQKNRKRRREGSIDMDFNDDDNTWVVGAIHQHDNVIDDCPDVIDSNSEMVPRSSKPSNDSHHKSIDKAYVSDNQIIFGERPMDTKHHQEGNPVCETNDTGNKSGWSKDFTYFSSNNPSKSHHTTVHHSGSHYTNDNHTSSHHTNDHHTTSHHTSDHHKSDHHTSDHHTTDHHTSHDSGHHTSHDTGGNYDSGTCDTGGWDSGGGDTGGCDSGGGDAGCD